MMITLDRDDIQNIAKILMDTNNDEYAAMLQQMADVMCSDDEIKIDDCVIFTHG